MYLKPFSAAGGLAAACRPKNASSSLRHARQYVHASGALEVRLVGVFVGVRLAGVRLVGVR
jgi:hypothetical protein